MLPFSSFHLTHRIINCSINSKLTCVTDFDTFQLAFVSSASMETVSSNYETCWGRVILNFRSNIGYLNKEKLFTMEWKLPAIIRQSKSLNTYDVSIAGDFTYCLESKTIYYGSNC